jgi:endonuclease YncB( thermonuclease family)
MGLADRVYMRKREVRWDESRSEMRLDGEELPRPPGSSLWFRWLAVLVAIVVAGLWWYRAGGPPLPTVEVPAATVQDAPGGPVAMVESDNPVLVGRVTRVLDGDTIEVALSSGPIRVRFGSVDAPEKNQPWGREARDALTRKLGDREVALDVVSQDQYDRLVAVVGLDDENVNAWLVQRGYAWAYREYTKSKNYCAWEAEARSAQRGLWALPAAQRHAPWEFRAVQRGRAGGFTDYSNETVAQCIAAMHRKLVPVAGAASATAASPMSTHSGCKIKGNVSGSGKIYHLPGSYSYDRTKIDESKGERWFCTEDEARAAGWRARKG